MTKNRGNVQRRFSQLPDVSIPVPEPEHWYPPEPNPELEYRVDIPMPELGRIIGRMQFDESHRMTEFSLTAQVYHADAWWDVMRVDTAHGEVHAHYMYRTRDYETREVIRPIYCQDDVDDGYELTETLLIASWTDHVRRWNGGS